LTRHYRHRLTFIANSNPEPKVLNLTLLRNENFSDYVISLIKAKVVTAPNSDGQPQTTRSLQLQLAVDFLSFRGTLPERRQLYSQTDTIIELIKIFCQHQLNLQPERNRTVIPPHVRGTAATEETYKIFLTFRLLENQN